VAGVDTWLIVGGRRWARIVATELCQLLPPSASIHLLGSPDDAELLAWWGGSPLRQQIKIVDHPVPCHYPMVGVALIVNSAYQHRSAIENAFSAGYNVVSEKPMTLSRDESQQLLSRATELGLKLFSANTYLFSNYLSVFKRDWLDGRKITEIHLTWADAAGERRYGQMKSYDSGVPVIFDVIPHIASIVLATHGDVIIDRAQLAVRRGGSEVIAQFECGETVVSANMSRNSTRRVRLARFSGPASEVAIDFSVEPGTVSLNHGEAVCADPGWQTKRKPLAEMLHSVQLYFESGEMDDRLSPNAALLGNDMIDRVAASYVQQQIDFLGEQNNAKGPEFSADFAYAAKEIDAIKNRVLPFLPQESPLQRLVMAHIH
jgi:predicted dehydrogenase